MENVNGAVEGDLVIISGLGHRIRISLCVVVCSGLTFAAPLPDVTLSLCFNRKERKARRG